MSRLIDADELLDFIRMLPVDLGHREVEDIKNHIEEMRKIEQEQQWIPCSERLPKKNENVILQVNGFAPDENTDYYHCPCIGRYVGKLGENGTALWWIESMKSMTDMRAVTVEAWMPLPDPYRPEE